MVGAGTSLSERLTTAEAHGQPWALVVRHAAGRLELHKTDTFKRHLDECDLHEAIADLPASFVLADDRPVAWTRLRRRWS
jgi:hypothetical protein